MAFETLGNSDWCQTSMVFVCFMTLAKFLNPQGLSGLICKAECHPTVWMQETKPEKALSIFNMCKAKRYKMQNK